MWEEKEAPINDTLEGRSIQSPVSMGDVFSRVSTYASRTTPIRRVVAVPNRPMNQVAIGDTSMATHGSVSRVTLSIHRTGMTYILIWTARQQKQSRVERLPRWCQTAGNKLKRRHTTSSNPMCEH